MARLNWANSRQSPTDQDDITPSETDYSFDYRRSTVPGTASWPERHGKERFGPALIGKAWKTGLVVVAEIEGLPHPVAAVETRWLKGILQVKTLGNWYLPERIWTRKTPKGLSSCGELLEEG